MPTYPYEIRFEIQLNKVEALLRASSDKKNKALWLFHQDLRTPFFMLEGLARMHKGVGDKKPFTKWLKRFKELEDTLGLLDYKEGLISATSSNKNIPAVVKRKWNESFTLLEVRLNEILIQGDWYNGKRITKIRRKLSGEDRGEMLNKGLRQFLLKEIDELISFHAQCPYQDMEADVHELRRRLRWISIYSAALQGTIALKASRTTTTIHKKYLVKDILQSPYNILPRHKELSPLIFLDSHSFYALSFMISRLGKIKDAGLLITGLQQAGLKSLNKPSKADHAKELTKLLSEASQLANQFFNEDHLHQLILP